MINPRFIVICLFVAGFAMITLVRKEDSDEGFRNQTDKCRNCSPMVRRDHRHLNEQQGKPDYPYNLDNLVPDDYNFTSYQPLGGFRFEEYKKGLSPYRVTNDTLQKSDQLARSRRIHVKRAMQFAYGAYEEFAFGSDELLPVTKESSEVFGGLSTTLIDSLSTLWLLDLKDEFYRARDFVRDNLTFDGIAQVNAFETTIRILGGLLSAYDLSKDANFLWKAEDLGSRLIEAFKTKSGIPLSRVDLSTGKAKNQVPFSIVTAEAGTLQLEHRYLAKATQRKEYAELTERTFDVMRRMKPSKGLYPCLIQNRRDPPKFLLDLISFGSGGDSFYEYMLKLWLQGGRVETVYREMYDESIQGLHDELLQKTGKSGLVYVAELYFGVLSPRMDHLTSFWRLHGPTWIRISQSATRLEDCQGLGLHLLSNVR
jgi:Glycosyl hydrolase family 47